MAVPVTSSVSLLQVGADTIAVSAGSDVDPHDRPDYMIDLRTGRTLWNFSGCNLFGLFSDRILRVVDQATSLASGQLRCQLRDRHTGRTLSSFDGPYRAGTQVETLAGDLSARGGLCSTMTTTDPILRYCRPRPAAITS